MLSTRKIIETVKRRLFHRQTWIKAGILALIFSAVYLAAWLLRFNGIPPKNATWNQIFVSIGLVVALKLLVFAGSFVTNNGGRTLPLAKLALAATTSSVLLWVGNVSIVPGEAIPRTVILLDWFGTIVAMGAIWPMIRSGTERGSEQQQQTHLEYLRDLRRKMRRDRDPRTGDLVTKLRTIYQHLEQSAETANADYGGILPQIHEQARELYQSCLALLEHTFELWDTGRGLADKSNRESLAAEREEIIEEVQQSVEHLDRTMDELRKAELRRNQSDRGHDKAGAVAEQARLREELSQGIETALAVEQRMVRLEEELGLRGPKRL